MRYGQRGRRVAESIGVVAVVLLVGVACEPVHHQAVVVREVGTRISDLSADGRYVTATRTPPPAEGARQQTRLLRIDRTTGAELVVDEDISTPYRPVISRDGQRVLFRRYSAPTIWVVWTPGHAPKPAPGGVSMNDQLTYGGYTDANGRVRTWSYATGAIADPEAGTTRPAGYTIASFVVMTGGDGQQVRFSLTRSDGACITRFIEVGPSGPRVDDYPSCTVQFTSDGEYFVRSTGFNRSYQDSVFPFGWHVGGAASFEFGNRRTRQVLASRTAPENDYFWLGFAGHTLWAVHHTFSDSSVCMPVSPFEERCLPYFAIDTSEVLAIGPVHQRSFPVTGVGGGSDGYNSIPEPVGVSANGRFFAISGFQNHLLDDWTGTDEIVTGRSLLTSLVADDASVVVTNNLGWSFALQDWREAVAG